MQHDRKSTIAEGAIFLWWFLGMGVGIALGFDLLGSFALWLFVSWVLYMYWRK